MRKIVCLSLSLVGWLFAGCAAEIEVVDNDELGGVNQPFVEGSGCIEASLPAGECVDYGTIKTQTYEICLQADMQLTGLIVDPNADCNNGSGTSGAVEYQCCPAAPPGPPPPPKPEPEPAVCTGGTIGDGTCQSYADLKMAAWETCKQGGSELVDVLIDQGACAEDEAASIAYKCCAAAPSPPPEPQVCTGGTIGDGTCQSYDDLKMGAWEACKATGFSLFDLVLDNGACAAGQAASAAYKCCGGGEPTPPPQPPVPGVCTTGTIGDGTCQDYGDYKMVAWEACNQAGATLINLTIDNGACTDGKAASMVYTCISSGDYCP